MASDIAKNAFPKPIAEAVIKVMAALGTLAKANENKFDKYNFASIDDFIEFVRPHMIEAGLFILLDEADAPKLVDVAKKDGKPMAMWWAPFEYYIVTADGSSAGPFRKTVMVQASGAQSSGSAQSYAEKQIMRSLFKIPTREGDDPDKEKVEISARKGENETDLQRVAGRIRRKLLTAASVDDLGLAWADNSIDIDHIKRVSDTAYNFLKQEYDRRKAELEAG